MKTTTFRAIRQKEFIESCKRVFRKAQVVFKITFVVVVAGVFLWTIYPTPYAYYTQGGNYWRVNRFTGFRRVASGKGWKREFVFQAEQDYAKSFEEGTRRIEDAQKKLDKDMDKIDHADASVEVYVETHKANMQIFTTTCNFEKTLTEDAIKRLNQVLFNEDTLSSRYDW